MPHYPGIGRQDLRPGQDTYWQDLAGVQDLAGPGLGQAKPLRYTVRYGTVQDHWNATRTSTDSVTDCRRSRGGRTIGSDPIGWSSWLELA